MEGIKRRKGKQMGEINRERNHERLWTLRNKLRVVQREGVRD